MDMKGNSDAQVLLSQGSEKSATSYAQALWEEERRYYFLRTSEQVGQRQIPPSQDPFDLRKGRKEKPSKALLTALYEETPLNANDIAVLYHVSGSTVRHWLARMWNSQNA